MHILVDRSGEGEGVLEFRDVILVRSTCCERNQWIAQVLGAGNELADLVGHDPRVDFCPYAFQSGSLARVMGERQTTRLRLLVLD